MVLLYHKHKNESSLTSTFKEFNVDDTLRVYSVTISKVSEGTSHTNKGFFYINVPQNPNLILFRIKSLSRLSYSRLHSCSMNTTRISYLKKKPRVPDSLIFDFGREIFNPNSEKKWVERKIRKAGKVGN